MPGNRILSEAQHRQIVEAMKLKQRVTLWESGSDAAKFLAALDALQAAPAQEPTPRVTKAMLGGLAASLDEIEAVSHRIKEMRDKYGLSDDAQEPTEAQPGDAFCDANCTWRDHAPGCVRAEAPRSEAAELVGEIVLFGGDLKEVAWRQGKMPAPGTKLYAHPPSSEAPQAPVAQEWLERGMELAGDLAMAVFEERDDAAQIRETLRAHLSLRPAPVAQAATPAEPEDIRL